MPAASEDPNVTSDPFKLVTDLRLNALRDDARRECLIRAHRTGGPQRRRTALTSLVKRVVQYGSTLTYRSRESSSGL